MDQITSAFATLQSVQDIARLAGLTHTDDDATTTSAQEAGLSEADRERLQAARAAATVTGEERRVGGGGVGVGVGRKRVVTKTKTVGRSKAKAAAAQAKAATSSGRKVGGGRKLKAKKTAVEEEQESSLSTSQRERMEAMYAYTPERMLEDDDEAAEERAHQRNVMAVKARGNKMGGATSVLMNRKGKKELASQDSVTMYLKEIGQVKLLTGKQEVELARLVQDLLAMETVRDRLREDLSKQAVSDTEWAAGLGMTEDMFRVRLERARAGKEQMVQANLRLVVSIAKNYRNRGLTLQDLIQEGSLGLIRGAEKFDHRRGYKFSTYAHWWIRQAITRAIADQSRTIRLPVHLFEIMSRIKKATKALDHDLGREPTDAEVAEAMGMTVEKIQMIYKASQAPLSMENLMGSEEEARKLEDTIEDENQATPEDSSVKGLLREDMENVLNTLSPRERDVLRLRYGLEDGKVKTLEEIGNVFHVTRERIRQIEAKALRKLRQPSRNMVLSDYLHHEAKAGRGMGMPLGNPAY